MINYLLFLTVQSLTIIILSAYVLENRKNVGEIAI